MVFDIHDIHKPSFPILHNGLLATHMKALRNSAMQLSLEQLQIIFRYCTHLNTCSVTNTKGAPLAFTQVCRQWRAAAFRIPQAWDELFLQIVQNPPLQAIRSNTRELRLEVEHEEQLDGMLNAETYSFDILEAVYLSVGEPHTGGNPITYPLLKSAPRFHVLYLDLPIYPQQHLSSLGFPWAQMTHVCLDGNISLRAWHDLIRACPLLEKLYVDFNNQDIPDNDDWVDKGGEEYRGCSQYKFDEIFETGAENTMSLRDYELHRHGKSNEEEFGPVVLNSLTKLRLTFSSQLPPAVLIGVTLPLLRTLAVNCRRVGYGYIPGPHDIRFFHQVAPLLRNLCIERLKIEADAVLEILQHAPMLVKLTLECQGDHDNLLLALIVSLGPTAERGSRSDPILVPRLESFFLSITNTGWDEEVVPSLSAMVFAFAVQTRFTRFKKQLYEANRRQMDVPRSFYWTLQTDASHASVREDIEDLTHSIIGLEHLHLSEAESRSPNSVVFDHQTGDIHYTSWGRKLGFAPPNTVTTLSS